MKITTLSELLTRDASNVTYGIVLGVAAGICASVALAAMTQPAHGQTTTSTGAVATSTSSSTSTYPVYPLFAPSSATTTAYPYQMIAPTSMTTSGTNVPTTSSSTSSPAVPTIPVVPTSTSSAPAMAPNSTAVPGLQFSGVPEVLTVNNAGTLLIRGTVMSVGANTISLESWGGTWTIQVSGSTTVTPGGQNSLAGVSNGDFVGVAGSMALGQEWTVNATVVHDWTTSAAGESASSESTSAVQGSGVVSTAASSTSSNSNSSAPSGDTLYTGTATDVSNISSGSFTLTSGNGTTYTVTIPSGATIWNSNRKAMPLSSISQNDSIRVDGTLESDGSIAADVVRDTSQ